MSEDIHNYTYNNKYDNSVITSEKFDAATWNLIEKVPDQVGCINWPTMNSIDNGVEDDLRSTLPTGVDALDYLSIGARRVLRSRITFQVFYPNINRCR